MNADQKIIGPRINAKNANQLKMTRMPPHIRGLRILITQLPILLFVFIRVHSRLNFSDLRPSAQISG
jgi:hypothetical protein